MLKTILLTPPPLRLVKCPYLFSYFWNVAKRSASPVLDDEECQPERKQRKVSRDSEHEKQEAILVQNPDLKEDQDMGTLGNIEIKKEAKKGIKLIRILVMNHSSFRYYSCFQQTKEG